MRQEILEKIDKNFKLSKEEKSLIELALVDKINMPRLLCVIDTMISFRIEKDVLVAYVVFQNFKVTNQDTFKAKLSKEQQKLYEIFKLLRDVTTLTKSGNSEDIRRMFMAICQDMRVVIVKFATILYDLKLISLPLDEKSKAFVQMVSDIFVPLAERLGLSYFKNELEDKCFELLEPEAFNELKNDALMKTEDNEKQIAITRAKLQEILDELGIKGEIQARQKHFYSVYRKLVKKNITLGKVYDLLAMRVLVPTVDDCYAVFGKIHSIYRPIAGRVKDYIATPKPNGYQSLHTTIIADNNRPLEIQIRTFEMHRQGEYGVAAHWIYKESGRERNKFDEKLAWFRQILENANQLSGDEFLETLKIDLYGESIFVQTPKGKVLEFPLGATVIDFAYAIHSDIGNSCTGGKINGKIVPINTQLSNGDVVEILTSPNKKPSRDWLKFVKTSSARSKIRAFFKSEFKEENIKSGKSFFEQAVSANNILIGKSEKDKYLQQIAESLMIENVDGLFAEIGAGSLPVGSVVGRLLNLYSKDKAKPIKNDILKIKKNKEGVLIDGDSGLLIRYAGCCNPVPGEEIVGYISRGHGVTIHRKDCHNVQYLENERLIRAEWQDTAQTEFTAAVKVQAENRNTVINNLNTAARAMKDRLKGFGYKEENGDLMFDIIVQISDKAELDKLIKSFENIKFVKKVYRSA